jgi:hypothetical protein
VIFWIVRRPSRHVGVEPAAQLAHEAGAHSSLCDAISASAGLSFSVGMNVCDQYFM